MGEGEVELDGHPFDLLGEVTVMGRAVSRRQYDVGCDQGAGAGGLAALLDGDDVDDDFNQRELSSNYGLLNAGTSSSKRKKRDNPHLTQEDPSNSMNPKSQTNDSRDYRSMQTRLVGDVQNLNISSSAGAERIIRDILPAAAVGVAASALVLALYRMRNSK